MRHPYPTHGRRWSVWHPFRWICRCGLDAYPCSVERSWRRWNDAVAAAREWQAEQRHQRGLS